MKKYEFHAIESLAEGSSAIHRLHPAVKMACALIFIVCVVSFDRYATGELAVYFFYPFLMITLAEIPFGLIAKRVALALPFALLAGISNLIFDTGTAGMIGGLAVSYGMLSFLSILLKTLLCVAAVLVLSATTPLAQMTDQMLGLHLPQPIVLLIAMIYRYLEILFTEAGTMKTAYLLRAPKDKSVRMRDMGSFAGQLLLRSFSRAERVYAAMKCRGYSGKMGASRRRALGLRDVAFAALVVGGCTLFRFIPTTAILARLF